MMGQYKRILNLALPAMAENLLQMLMGVVDNYLVAQVGLIAVSGVSVANNIITIYQALFIALGAAVSSLIAKTLGERNHTKTLIYQNEALLVTVLLGIGLGLFSLLFGKTILSLLGTENAVSQTGGLYLSIVGGGIISLGLFTTLGSILRSMGKVQLPMYLSLITNLLNAILSALSIYIFNWGIVGVAVATVASRLIAVVYMVTQIDLQGIKEHLTWKVSREFFQLSLPAAGERLMMRAGDVVIVAIIVLFGTEVVAGNAIGETLTQFNYMPGMGIATATVILTARANGENNRKEVKKIVNSSYLIATILMLAIGAVVYLLGPVLNRQFTTDIIAIQASQVVLFYSFIGGPATAGTLILTAAWQGLGNAKLPFYATTFGMWVIRLLLGYLLGVSLNMGLTGVWLATVADNLFRSIFLYILYRNYIRKAEV